MKLTGQIKAMFINILQGSEKKWSNVLWEKVGLVTIFEGVGRIGQTFINSRSDWLNFSWEWAGLVTISSE